MKDPRPVNLLKTALVLLLAILSTFIVGTFSGYPDNPDFARARIQEINDYHQTQQVFTSEEINGFYDRLKQDAGAPPKVHPVIAIIDWYPIVLGASAILFLLFFRPWGIYFFASYCLGIASTLVLVGTVPAIMLAVAGSGYTAIWYALNRRKNS